MPYIILNNTAINRSKDIINRFILVSCVVNSPVSPEEPKHITSIEDLDLFFEKDFPEYDYFVELLKKNVGLLLYKPVSPDLILPDIYFDYENYEESGGDECYTDETDLPPIGKEGILYISKSQNSGPWIWVDNLYYDIKNLPQNLKKKTRSTNIRDSLRIMEYGTLENYYHNYCYPKYSDKYKIEDINLPEKINFDDYFSGRSSFSYTIKFKKNINFDSGKEKGLYLGFSVLDEIYLIWFSNGNQLDPIGSDYIERGNKYEIRYIDPETKGIKDTQTVIDEVMSILQEKGYKILERNEDDFYIKYEVYIDKLSPSINLYNIPGFSIDINKSITNQILSDHTKKKSRIEFFSKTIGNAKEKIKIKISQVKRKSGFYTIEISKYDYIEVFTGSLFPTLSSRNINEEMLDTVINRESKIVSCNLNRYRQDGSQYKPEDSDSSLYLGEWHLDGGEDEEYNYLYFQESLKRLEEVPDFREDFLLVPNIDYFRTNIPVYYDYYPEYEILLDYAKKKDCQILIDNFNTQYEIREVTELPKINITFDISEEKEFDPLVIYKLIYFNKFNEKIVIGHYKYDLHKKEMVDVSTNRDLCNGYMNNFIFNYTLDKENYLVYFYRKITLPSYIERPAFYVFLDNIITGVFETRKTRILYKSPLKERFLITEKEEKELLYTLEKRKSNYLSYNNHYYYYDQLFNSDSEKHFDIITKYLISKVRRSLEVRKWDILNRQTETEKIQAITTILKHIAITYYSIVRNITINDINIDYNKRTLSFKLQLTYTELINKDIYVNITINT